MTLDAEAFDAEAATLDVTDTVVTDVAAGVRVDVDSASSQSDMSVGGERARRVTEFLAKALVDEPAGIEIDAISREGETKLIVRAAPGDVGRLIGRRGRTVQAMRQVARAAGAPDNERIQLDVVD